MKTIAATEFKTHCLSILDDVVRAQEEIVILKRGKPVARLLPFVAGRTAQSTLLGSMTAADDLLEPPLPPEAWEVEGDA